MRKAKSSATTAGSKRKNNTQRTSLAWVGHPEWTWKLVNYLKDHPEFRLKLFSDATADASKDSPKKEVDKYSRKNLYSTLAQHIFEDDPEQGAAYRDNSARFTTSVETRLRRLRADYQGHLRDIGKTGAGLRTEDVTPGSHVASLIEKVKEQFKWWDELHAFWRALPNYNPIGVANGAPGIDHAAEAQAAFQSGDKVDEGDGGVNGSVDSGLGVDASWDVMRDAGSEGGDDAEGENEPDKAEEESEEDQLIDDNDDNEDREESLEGTQMGGISVPELAKFVTKPINNTVEGSSAKLKLPKASGSGRNAGLSNAWKSKGKARMASKTGVETFAESRVLDAELLIKRREFEHNELMQKRKFEHEERMEREKSKHLKYELKYGARAKAVVGVVSNSRLEELRLELAIANAKLAAFSSTPSRGQEHQAAVTAPTLSNSSPIPPSSSPAFPHPGLQNLARSVNMPFNTTHASSSKTCDTIDTTSSPASNHFSDIPSFDFDANMDIFNTLGDFSQLYDGC